MPFEFGLLIASLVSTRLFKSFTPPPNLAPRAMRGMQAKGNPGPLAQAFVSLRTSSTAVAIVAARALTASVSEA
jgi:hypothetical protein